MLLNIALAVGCDLHGLAGDGRSALSARTDAACAEGDTGHKRGELAEVAAVQGEFDDSLGFNDRPESGVLGAQQRRCAADLDRLDLIAHLHLEVDAGFLLELKLDTAAHFGLEAHRGARHLVFADVQQGENVDSCFVGGCGAHVAGGPAAGCDSCAGNYGAGWVGDQAEDFGGDSLAEQNGAAAEDQQQGNPKRHKSPSP